MPDQPPADWQADKGWGYAPGAGTDSSLRQLVQDKLIRYPEAIAKALSRDVNRYIEAGTDVATFVKQALAEPQRTAPLWLGFADAPAVSRAVGQDVSDYFILLPSDAPRHVENSHGHDGDGQRPAQPGDYRHLAGMLGAADEIRPGTPGPKEQARILVMKRIGGELFRAVFEVRPGKRNRALTLVSLVIKTD